MYNLSGRRHFMALQFLTFYVPICVSTMELASQTDSFVGRARMKSQKHAIHIASATVTLISNDDLLTKNHMLVRSQVHY